jgi:hypothetical protein
MSESVISYRLVPVLHHDILKCIFFIILLKRKVRLKIDRYENSIDTRYDISSK